MSLNKPKWAWFVIKILNIKNLRPFLLIKNSEFGHFSSRFSKKTLS